MSQFCLSRMVNSQDAKPKIARCVILRYPDIIKALPGEPPLLFSERRNHLIEELGRRGGNPATDKDILKQSGMVLRDQDLETICQALEEERLDRERGLLAVSLGPDPETAA